MRPDLLALVASHQIGRLCRWLWAVPVTWLGFWLSLSLVPSPTPALRALLRCLPRCRQPLMPAYLTMPSGTLYHAHRYIVPVRCAQCKINRYVVPELLGENYLCGMVQILTPPGSMGGMGVGTKACFPASDNKYQLLCKSLVISDDAG